MMNKGAWERERLIRREASSWYWRLKSPDLSAHEREEHQRWLAVPEHQEAFTSLSNDWERWRKIPWPQRSEERAAPTSQTYTRPAMRPSCASYGATGAAVEARVCVVAEEAAYWYFACVDDPQLLRADRREFLAWMRRSPENIAELFKIALLDGRLRRLKLAMRALGLPRANVIELAAVGVPEELHRHIAGRPRPTFPLKLLAAATTAMLIAIGMSFLVGDNTNHRVIATTASQWVQTTLNDGTVVYIDARTRLEIEFTPAERTVHIYKGSALFDVAKDPQRPFVVSTSLIDMTAVGTRFGVSIDSGVRTTVSEGVVRVDARGQVKTPVATLQAGEELFVSDDSLAKPVVTRVNAERKLEWSTGWLTFEGETIGQAVQEFNRRNVVQIQIEDPEIVARMLVYGRFRVDSPAYFARFIAHPEGLTLVEDPSGKTIRLQPK
jgi:transmembrane sensor